MTRPSTTERDLPAWVTQHSTDVRPTPLDPERKRALEAENRRLLEADLFESRLRFESTPRVVELQLSNFCNMSCTMCYDGDNPPMVKLDDRLVRYLADHLLPRASVLIPFATSEPLIVTWDITRELAQDYGVELEITTNVQFLDEGKFAELEPHCGVLEFSIDSHVPEVFEAIRLRSRPDKVFENLPVAARLAREHKIKVSANVVMMAENAPYLDETVRYLADAGVPWIHVQKLYYNKPESHLSDPMAHFSREWLDWMKQRCRDVAAEKKVMVDLDFDGREVVDHLPEDIEFRPNRTYDGWIEKLRRHWPGYCPQSVYRLKVDNEGNAYPCCVGDGERLKMGNVYEQPIEEIWNGPSMQDLRRAMLTNDLPKTCERCNFRTGPILGEMEQRPFTTKQRLWLENRRERWTIELLEPAHLARVEEPPLFRWTAPPEPVDHFEVVISVGGEDVDHVFYVPGDQFEFQATREDWDVTVANVAHWWAVYGVAGETQDEDSVRSKTSRALFRHQAIPRVEGSLIDYEHELGI